MTTQGTIERPASGKGIDPRIRARRIAVRRDEGRRRLSRLLRLLVFVLIVAALAGATRTPLLDVDRVQVAGALHTPLGAVLAAANIDVGDPMTDIDLSAARQGIDDLPWVDTVTVTRQWPGTVRVHVVERTPVAAVPAGQGGWLLVDREGRLLEPAGQPPPELVQLADVQPGGEAGGLLPAADADALLVAAAVPKELIGRVVAVAPAADGGLELRLADGARIAFGTTDEVARKLLATATVLDQVDVHCLAVLDVRVPGAPVLTHVAGCV